jgi:hypothetical protein
MTSNTVSDKPQKPGAGRTLIASRGRLIGAYIFAFVPSIFIAIALGMAQGSELAPAANALLNALIMFPFIALGWLVLYRTVARVEIDDVYISTTSIFGTRRSLALRDITSDIIVHGGKGGESLVLKTAAGKRLSIPDLSLSDAELKSLRYDIAARVHKATGHDIMTALPPPTPAEMKQIALVIVLLPLLALLLIAASGLLRKHGG